MSLGEASAPSGAHRPVRVGLVAWSSLFLIVVAPFVWAGQPYRDVLGLRPGMPERDVHARMEKLGKPAGGESEEGEGRRETWLLRDRRFASITFEFDSEMALDWATAFVRPRGKGRGVRYTDIGDIGRAQRYGNYIYTWVLPCADWPADRNHRAGERLHLDFLGIHPSLPARFRERAPRRGR